MKHLLKISILPSFTNISSFDIIKLGGKDSNLPFVILTMEDNKLTYTPDKIYKMNGMYITNAYGTKVNYISLDDVNVKDIKDNSKIAVNKHDYLYFLQYSYDAFGGLILKNMTNYKSYFVNKKLIFNSDSIDVKDEHNDLITTLTLTGLKKKNSNERDFVGEIACYNDKLIKVDRTNPNNPTVQLLFFNESQYKDDYEMEKRIKLFIYIGDYL